MILLSSTLSFFLRVRLILGKLDSLVQNTRISDCIDTLSEGGLLQTMLKWVCYCVSCVQLFATPWTAAYQASLCFTVSQSCSNSCPLSWWCHPIISSSAARLSSCPQSFLTWWSFPVSRCFALGGQSIRASASASVFPMKIQDWFPLGWTGWISLLSKGLSRVFPALQFKSISSLALSLPYCQAFTSTHDYH